MMTFKKMKIGKTYLIYDYKSDLISLQHKGEYIKAIYTRRELTNINVDGFRYVHFFWSTDCRLFLFYDEELNLIKEVTR